MSYWCKCCDKPAYQDGYCFYHLMRKSYGVRDDDKKKVRTVNNVQTVNKSALPWKYKPYEPCKPRNETIVAECNRQQCIDKKIIVATIEQDGKFLCRACGAEFNIDAGTTLASIECPRCHSYSVKHI